MDGARSEPPSGKRMLLWYQIATLHSQLGLPVSDVFSDDPSFPGPLGSTYAWDASGPGTGLMKYGVLTRVFWV